MKTKTDERHTSTSTGIEDILLDFPPGPLDTYRKQCSFNWREMALVMDNEQTLRFKHLIWKRMENDPLFAHSAVEPSLEDNRCLTLARAFKFSEITPHEDVDPRLMVEMGSIVGQYDWSVCIRRAALLGFFTNAIRGLGTQKHSKFVHAAGKHELTGTVAMTEISHGTNTKAFRTRATFDPVKQKFILHTPDFEAAKCWAANMGKTANHAYVLAQLYTPDGECHGLHGFIVKIRDSQMNLMPGVIVGDMGEKVGMNGLDNGFMMFDNYELEMDALLDKTGSVTTDGRYVSPIKDTKKRFSASLGNLSGPRIGIVAIATANMTNAISISIRYSAVRRQFGPPDSAEMPVIEYQMQQCRLFPYLAATYVFKHFSGHLFDLLIDFMLSQFNTEVSPEVRSKMGVELHGISCASKSVASWLARDAAQESREACGGHGYLRAAGLGRLRNDGDAFLTFEGDNNVLLQQTSNWLINIWGNPKREKIAKTSPFGALSFLTNADSRLKKKFEIRTTTGTDFLQPKALLLAYKWLVCYLLRSASEKYQSLQVSGEDQFTARNESQTYQARTLSIAFVEHYALETFRTKLINVKKSDLSPEIRKFLTDLMLIYGLWSLEKHLGILYEGGYFSGPRPARMVKETVVELCKGMKTDAVSAVDAICPPDFILNSVLGVSDGQVYKHLETAMKQTPGCFEKTRDWKSIAERLVAKL